MDTKPITVDVTWGKKKYDVILDPAAGVAQFKSSLEELTDVPIAAQTLLSDGREIKEDTDLTEIPFKDGTKIVLMASGRSQTKGRLGRDDDVDVVEDKHEADVQETITSAMTSLKKKILDQGNKENREKREKYLEYKMIDRDLEITFNDCLRSYSYSHINSYNTDQPSVAQKSSNLVKNTPVPNNGAMGQDSTNKMNNKVELNNKSNSDLINKWPSANNNLSPQEMYKLEDPFREDPFRFHPSVSVGVAGGGGGGDDDGGDDGGGDDDGGDDGGGDDDGDDGATDSFNEIIGNDVQSVTNDGIEDANSTIRPHHYDPWANDNTYNYLKKIKYHVFQKPCSGSIDLNKKQAEIVLNAVFALFLKDGNSVSNNTENMLYTVEKKIKKSEKYARDKLFFIRKYSEFIQVVDKITVNGKPLKFNEIISTSENGFYMTFFRLFILKQRVHLIHRFKNRQSETPIEFYGPITLVENNLKVNLKVNFVNATWLNAGIFKKNDTGEKLTSCPKTAFELKFAYPDSSDLFLDALGPFDTKNLYNYEFAAFATLIPSAYGGSQSASENVPKIAIAHTNITNIGTLSSFENSISHTPIFFSYILYLIFKKLGVDVENHALPFVEILYEYDESDKQSSQHGCSGKEIIILPYHYFDFFQTIDNDLVPAGDVDVQHENVDKKFNCFLRKNFVGDSISEEFDHYVEYFQSYLFKFNRKVREPTYKGEYYINNSLCKHENYQRPFKRSDYKNLIENVEKPWYCHSGEIQVNHDNGFMDHSAVFEIQAEPYRGLVDAYTDATSLTNANRIMNTRQTRSHTVNSITNRLIDFDDFIKYKNASIFSRLYYQKRHNESFLARTDDTLINNYCQKTLPWLENYNTELSKFTNKTYLHRGYQLNHIPVLFDGRTDYNINVYFNTTPIIDFTDVQPNKAEATTTPNAAATIETTTDAPAISKDEEESKYIKIAAFLNVLSYQTTNVVNNYIENSNDTIEDIPRDSNPQFNNDEKTHLYAELKKTRKLDGEKVKPIRHLMALYPDVDHGVYSKKSELISNMNVFRNNELPKTDKFNIPALTLDQIKRNTPYFDKLIFSKEEEKKKKKKKENEEEEEDKYTYFPMQHHIHVFGIFNDAKFEKKLSELYIIFRGSYTLKDWIDIDKAIQNGVGYNNTRLNNVKYTLRVISKVINNYLDNNTKVIISGHSLGGFLGAYATIAAKNTFTFGMNTIEKIFTNGVDPGNIIPILFDPFFPEYVRNQFNNTAEQIRFANFAGEEPNDLNWFEWGSRNRFWSGFEGTFPKYEEHLSSIDNGWIVRVAYDLASYSLYYSMKENRINGGIKIMNINSCVETIDNVPGNLVDFRSNPTQFRNSHSMSHFIGAKQYSQIYGWGITCENAPLANNVFKSLLFAEFNADSNVRNVNNLISKNDSLLPEFATINESQALSPENEGILSVIFNFFKLFIHNNKQYYGENRRVSPFTQNILFDINLNNKIYPVLKLLPCEEGKSDTDWTNEYRSRIKNGIELPDDVQIVSTAQSNHRTTNNRGGGRKTKNHHITKKHKKTQKARKKKTIQLRNKYKQPKKGHRTIKRK
mgnify:CR=1 FL=1